MDEKHYSVQESPTVTKIFLKDRLNDRNISDPGTYNRRKNTKRIIFLWKRCIGKIILSQE